MKANKYDDLDTSEFVAKVKEHMKDYKNNVIKISTSGTYKYRTEVKEYEHILPIKYRDMNILEKYRLDFLKSGLIKEKEWHMYSHHLNSSQVMCINFFYPLIKEKKLDLILQILGISDNAMESCFEKESDLEKDNERKTNFDFYIETQRNKRIYFEIKYTENGFGKAVNDKKHISKYMRTYKDLLQNCKAINDNYKNESIFFDNYQILRNLIHIDDNSYVVFIYPKTNKNIRSAAEKAYNNIIVDSWKNYFITITWEDINDKLVNIIREPELKDYYQKEFPKKYMIDD